MKKVILFAACLLALSTTINAQEAPVKPKTEKGGGQKLTPEQRIQKHVDDLNAIATLTEDQKNKVKALAATKIAKVDAIRAKYKGQTENKEIEKTELEAAKKEYHQNIKALLTPEQLEKVKAKQKENKASGIEKTE